MDIQVVVFHYRVLLTIKPKFARISICMQIEISIYHPWQRERAIAESRDHYPATNFPHPRSCTTCTETVYFLDEFADVV